MQRKLRTLLAALSDTLGSAYMVSSDEDPYRDVQFVRVDCRVANSVVVSNSFIEKIRPGLADPYTSIGDDPVTTHFVEHHALSLANHYEKEARRLREAIRDS